MSSIEFGFLPGLDRAMRRRMARKRESKMGGGVTISANAPASQTANNAASSAADTAQSAFGEALKQEAEEATQRCYATSSNSQEDVARFETSHAFFDVGKRLQTGELKAMSQGGKELPPPAGKQLQKLAGRSEQANRLAKEYAAKQGVEAGHVVKDNIQARSQAAADGLKETPHFGETSAKAIPEVGFKNGRIISAGKNPGGEPSGARTVDLGFANKPTPPSKWNQVVGQKGLKALTSTVDIKGGNAYVSDKAGFRKQSGGLEVKEVRPFTKGLKPSELGGYESNVSAPKPPAPGGPSKTVHMTPGDADVDLATGKVAAGPNTDAVLTRKMAQVGVSAPKAPTPELPAGQAGTMVAQGAKAENTVSAETPTTKGAPTPLPEESAGGVGIKPGGAVGPGGGLLARGAGIGGLAFNVAGTIGTLKLAHDFDSSMKLKSALTSGQYFEDFSKEIKQYPNGTRIQSRTEPVSVGVVPGAGPDESLTVLKKVPVGGFIVHSKDFDGIIWDDGVKWQSTFDSHNGFGMIIDEGHYDRYQMDKTGISLMHDPA